MKQAFADAFFFFALWNRHDFFHSGAVDYLRTFQGSLVTTQWILMEVADGLADTQQRPQVGFLFAQLEAAPTVKIIQFSDLLYRRGLSLYDERPDKAWSLTDCISFVVMEEKGIGEALTGDRHFVQAGFLALFAK